MIDAVSKAALALNSELFLGQSPSAATAVDPPCRPVGISGVRKHLVSVLRAGSATFGLSRSQRPILEASPKPDL